MKIITNIWECKHNTNIKTVKQKMPVQKVKTSNEFHNFQSFIHLIWKKELPFENFYYTSHTVTEETINEKL